MQVSQLGPWLYAVGGDKRQPQPAVGGERLGAGAAPVERGHQLRPGVLPERVSGDDAAQLSEHLAMPPEREPRVKQRVLGFLALVKELVLGADIGQVGDWRVAPQVECLSQGGGGVERVAAVERVPAFGHQIAEAVQVEFAWIDVDQVSGRMSTHALAVRQQLAYPVDAAT